MMRTRAQLPQVPCVCFGALTLALLLCPGTSHAAGRAEAHDGFMLRLAAGFGYGSGTEEVPVLGDVELSGGAGFFSLDIGGALVDNLVLHGRLSSLLLASPTVYVQDQEFDTPDDASLSFALLGVGLTYYLMPANVYFTGVVGVARASADDGTGDPSTTKAGFGLQGDIGKEWWVSDNWGLGVAGRLMYAAVPDEQVGDDSTTLHGLGFGVLFSATYQ